MNDPAPVITGVARLCARPVAAADRARAARQLLDWLGCAVAGAGEPAGQMLLQDGRPDAAARAFAWGGLGNILEMDDVDKRAILHPGPTIIPAALACAGAVEASGRDLLDAVVRGYEATIRLGRATGPGHYALWHTTGTCGPIGAAAACASLRGASDDVLAQALSLGVSQAAGLWQTRHEPMSMGKQLHTAHAARAGFDAARLAEAGFQGPLAILEGPQGLFAAACPDGDPQDVLVEPEAAWRIHDVSIKPWPACRHAHPAIDAALALRAQMDVAALERVTITTYPDALTFCDKPAPRTVIEAKFSLQHSVAVVLARGAPRLEDFSHAAIADPAIAAWRKMVRVRAGEPYASAYPTRFGAGLTAHGPEGDVIISTPDALGDPENPVSDAQVADKARSLMQAGGWSEAEADAAIAEVTALSEGGPAAPLLARLEALP